MDRLILASACACASLVCSPAAGQKLVYGSLVGIIRSEAGARLSGVQVLLVNRDTNLAREAVTDESGQYQIVNLQPGPYDVTFSLEQHRQVRRFIPVTQGEISRVDMTLARQSTADGTVPSPSQGSSSPGFRPSERLEGRLSEMLLSALYLHNAESVPKTDYSAPACVVFSRDFLNSGYGTSSCGGNGGNPSSTFGVDLRFQMGIVPMSVGYNREVFSTLQLTTFGERADVNARFDASGTVAMSTNVISIASGVVLDRFYVGPVLNVIFWNASETASNALVAGRPQVPIRSSTTTTENNGMDLGVGIRAEIRLSPRGSPFYFAPIVELDHATYSGVFTDTDLLHWNQHMTSTRLKLGARVGVSRRLGRATGSNRDRQSSR